ncbi:MAG: TRAP transporter small permease subunit [Thermodesulfobacteria bacterium]|nr:TRAP transporter small permease subunit [Thermodesulfobacteriota bacterium]
MTSTKSCPRLFKLIIHHIDALNERVGKAVSWLTLLLVLLVTLDVILRYGFNISFVAFEEMEWHLYALIFLLGAGYTLRHNGHVRVDVIYQRLPKRIRALINVIGVLLFLFPGCYLVIKTSIPFVLSSWAVHEGSADPGGLPARYILKAAIPLAFCLLAIQGLSMFLKNLCILMGRRIESEGRH